MNCNAVKPGLRVKSAATLGDTRGMFISQKYIDSRHPNCPGVVLNYVPGHGGDVWWVQPDDDGEVAAYSFTELELEAPNA